MSEVGDLVPVKINGYPVGEARVVEVSEEGMKVRFSGGEVTVPSEVE